MSAVYENDVSDVYDLLYGGRGQDFAADADILLDTAVRRRSSGAPVSALDVACGTGEHLRALGDRVTVLAGLEASGSMCAIAAGKLPAARIVHGDMRSFRLGRRFDLVCCLTSSIGYMADEDELTAAMTAMAAHLAEDGVLVVDPYWTPEAFLDGHVGREVVRDGDRAVVRLTTSRRTGRQVLHHAQYLISATTGIRHAVHEQPLTLFTVEEYLRAMRRAGCAAEHVPAGGGFAARGLLVGTR